jgi:hypothetical protein
MAAPKYVCFRQCYYANTYFNVGDILRPGIEPNKHFHVEGESAPEDGGPPVRAGDDPRSTKQIASDIMDNYPKVDIPPEAVGNRKALFALWVDAGQDAKPVPREPEPQPAPEGKKPGTTDKDVRFADMTPDQIADITQKGIAEKIERMYKQEFKFAGASKIDLIKRAVVVEEKYLAKKVGANAE